MLTINVSADVKRLTAQLGAIARKQIPFATAQALTDVAKDSRDALKESMRKAFDRPVARTLNSVKIKSATKAKQEAIIWIDDEPNKGIAPSKYLAAEAFGGPRHAKRFERALQARGLMPPGTFAVPASSAPLDGHGNLPANFIVQLLSYLGAFSEVGYRANMTQKRKGKIAGMTKSAGGFKTIGGVMYFVSNGKGKTAHLAPGIYSKKGIHGVDVRPIILFVRAPTYKVRLQFDKIVAETVDKQFAVRFEERLAKALATAR